MKSDSVSPREQALRDALVWYAEQANATSRYMTAKPPKDQAMLAVVTALSLDAGKRGSDALTAPAAQQPVADAPIVAWRIDYHRPCAGDQEYLSWRDIEPPEKLAERIAKLRANGHTCTPLYEAQRVADGRADALPILRELVACEDAPIEDDPESCRHCAAIAAARAYLKEHDEHSR